MKYLIQIIVILQIASCTAMQDAFNPITEDDQKLLEESSLNFEPLPIVQFEDSDISSARVMLGKKLYFDPILSINNQISCNTCHQLDQFGVDNQATSLGPEGKSGRRNTPTTYNAFLHIAQFWDGRAKDVEEQAIGHILNPDEMGMPSEKAVIKKLISSNDYLDDFKKSFPSDKNPVKYRNIGIAIGAFERTLVTPSRFDDYLRGDIRALSAKERNGLKKFTEMGCVTCHNGVAIGGGMYQRQGTVEEYPDNNDLGLYEITKNEDDKYFFKVPTLRNVTQTGPWLHDGSLNDLNEVIKLMGRHQLGIELVQEDIEDIHAFLESLTGVTPNY